MYLFARLWVLVCALFVVSCANTVSLKSIDELPQLLAENKVVKVSPAYLDETLKSLKGKTAVVEFATTWCEICKSIKRPLEKIAKKSDGSFAILVVDVTDDIDTLIKYDMKPMYPGFLIYSPDLKEPVRKYGGDKLEQIGKWVLNSGKRPSSVPLLGRSTALDKAPKAVLVAGSSENANFAQEIYNLRQVLVAKGLKDDEIACFYAKPDPLAYFADQTQFDEMAEGLGLCQHASRIEILRTIQKGLMANPETFFLYATSHGAAPAPELEEEMRKCYPFAPSLIIDGGDNECEGLDNLTPGAVASVIPQGNKTAKVMVFQGCFTGGFISATDDPEKNPSELAKLPAMTILTASRSDRPSFGCDAGSEVTVYGRGFAYALEKKPGSFSSVEWPVVGAVTEAFVESVEKKLRIKDRSEPKFFQRP